MRGHPRDILSAYVDGALTQAEAAGVAEHLAECASCRETVADLTAVRRLLGRVSAPAPHPSLLPRTLAHLSSAPRRRPAALRRLAAFSVAVAALLLILQIRLLPPQMTRETRDWYFKSHAQLSVMHPMADVALAAYLGTSLAYQPLVEGLGGTEERP